MVNFGVRAMKLNRSGAWPRFSSQTIGIGDAVEANPIVYFPVTGEVVDVGFVDASTRLIVHEDGTVEQR